MFGIRMRTESEGGEGRMSENSLDQYIKLHSAGKRATSDKHSADRIAWDEAKEGRTKTEQRKAGVGEVPSQTTHC